MSGQTPPAEVPGALDDRTKKAFDFLQDATKQIITLATAILTFTITFLKDIAKNADDVSRNLLTGSWIFLVVSAIAGLFVLLNMSGVLAKVTKPDIYKGSIRFLSLAQLGAFALALVLALAFGWRSST